MNDNDIDGILAQTWDDRRVSRSERRALKELIEGRRRPDDERHRFRQRAFVLAQQFASSGDSGQVIEWLEDVVRALWPPVEQGGGGVVSEAHFSPDGDVVDRIVRAFKSTRKRVDVCVFTITDDRIADAILACHRRGVDMRIITDDDKSFDRGSDVQRLREAGVPVRVDGSEHHMHHKFALFDRVDLLTGSYNWTRSAANFNQENVVVTRDPRLVSAFSSMFDDLWSTLAP